MPVKLKISMLNIAHSETLDTYIQAHAEKLHALHPAVIETDVTLELLSRRHVRGNEYAARMELRMPGHCVNIHHVTSEDAYTALRESFSAAHRQLSDAKRDVSRSRSFQRA
ncbi:MAG TPA: HPF/RaiA family ribosome-associated protein [Burkholderiales bacterium]|nr:HPF/RaiA family ribosome-associated protein [Burkholderiales bacterium]